MSRYRVTVYDHRTDTEAIADVDGDSFKEALWMAYGRMLADEFQRDIDMSRRTKRWKFE